MVGIITTVRSHETNKMATKVRIMVIRSHGLTRIINHGTKITNIKTRKLSLRTHASQ